MSSILFDMVWIDMETTGLYAEKEAPLELGVMLTDKEGHPIDAAEWIIVGDPDSEYWWHRCVADAQQHEIVGPMHRKSGLWHDYKTHRKRQENFISNVQDKIVDWLDDHDVEIGKYPICGNSVRLDRDFLHHYLPKVDQHFHYRIIDVSTIKELCKLNNPNLYKALGAYTDKMELHRVIPDLHDSIKEYKFYRDHFLFTGS